VIRCAEARRAAWIIRRSSTRWSFTGAEHDCTRKTSAPRIDSPNRQYASPFANVSCSTEPRDVRSRFAIRSASSALEVPEKTAGFPRESRDGTHRRISEVDELLAVELGEGTLLAARTVGETVAEGESREACFEIPEVEVRSRGKR